MRAFISLSHHDLSFVGGTVLPAVRGAGVDPWIYDAALPGDNWIEAVLPTSVTGTGSLSRSPRSIWSR